MYKEKLRALLEGLEGEKIDKLMEQSPEFLKEFGATITVYAKVGASISKIVKNDPE